MSRTPFKAGSWYYQLKKFTTLKLRVVFILVGIFKTLSLGYSMSSDPERTAPRRWGDEPGCMEVLQQRAGSFNIKRLLLIKENQISQVKGFSAFLCMGICKSLWSLKYSFQMHLSYLGQNAVFFPSWVPLGLTIGSGCSLMAASSDILLLPECP